MSDTERARHAAESQGAAVRPAAVETPTVVETPTSASSVDIESRAIVGAWITVVAGMLAGLVVFEGQARPLSGDDSVGGRAAGIASLVTAGAFIVGYLTHQRGEASASTRIATLGRVVAAFSLTLALAATAYLTVLAASEIFSLGFRGIEIDPFAGSLLVSIMCGIGAYLAYPIGARISTGDLALLLIVFLLVGTVFSTITAADPDWWRQHFSSLGTVDDRSGYAFNGTLAISGLIIATIARYACRDLLVWRGVETDTRITVVGAGLTLLGVLLALVGLVPISVAAVPHLVVAIGSLVVFVVLVAALPWLVRGLPRAMHLATVGIVVGVIVAVALRVTGYYNLTGLEFVAAGLMLVWLTVFVRTIAALAEHAAPGMASPWPAEPRH